MSLGADYIDPQLLFFLVARLPHSTCLPACRLIPDNPRRLLIFSSGGPDVPPHGLQSTIKSRDCSSVAIMTRLPPTRLLAPGPALNLIDRLPRYPEADTYPLPTKKRTGALYFDN